MKRQDSGFSEARVLAMWVPSMLETNQTRGPPEEYGLRASVTMRGPRSEPPMPMLMTSVMGLPVYPFQSPFRTCWQNDFIFSRTLLTSGITSLPSTRMGVFDRFRRATCSTARFSVKLIFSPLNMRSRAASTPLDLARSTSICITLSVTRFLE